MATPRYDPFRSARLIYRALELDSNEDQDLFVHINSEPTDFANSNARINRPQSRRDAADFLRAIADEQLLGVIICLAPDHASQEHKDGSSKPIPIGSIHLSRLPQHRAQHRFTEIGIDIVTPYQGKGYGSEAIRWATDWAFDVAGMHRVGVRAFEWNTGARRLYERLGFKFEGRTREGLWFRGRWWDDFQFGVLEEEWREMSEERKKLEEEKEMVVEG